MTDQRQGHSPQRRRERRGNLESFLLFNLKLWIYSATSASRVSEANGREISSKGRFKFMGCASSLRNHRPLLDFKPAEGRKNIIFTQDPEQFLGMFGIDHRKEADIAVHLHRLHRFAQGLFRLDGM